MADSRYVNPLGLLPEVWVEMAKFLLLCELHTLCCTSHEMHKFIWAVVIKSINFGEAITNEPLSICLGRIRDFGYAQVSHIDLSNCLDVTDPGLVAVSSIPTITDLDIGGLTSYTDRGFEALLSLEHLTHLRFTASHLSSDCLLGLTRLEKLAKLDLELCTPPGEADSVCLAHLAGLTALEELHISHQRDALVIEPPDPEYVDLTPLSRVKSLILPLYIQVDLHQFPYLQILNLSKCLWLHDDELFAPALSRLPLTSLDLSSCLSIPEPILNALESLTTLTQLNLGFTHQLEGQRMVHLRPLVRLVTLGLSQTGVTSKDLIEISDLTRLQTLLLDKNPIDDIEPISGLTNLQQLDFQYCHFAVPCIRHLKHMTQLSNLDLSYTNTKNTVISELRNLNIWSLRTLSFGGLNNVGIYSLRYPEFVYLKSLSFLSCPFSPEGLAYLTNLTKLEKLTFDHCFLGTGMMGGFIHLTGLTQLQSLSIFNCTIPDPGYSEIKMIKSLTSLTLHGCYTSDVDILHLLELNKLKTLILGSSRMTRTGVKLVKDLRSLVRLELPDFLFPQSDQDFLVQHNPRLKIVAATSPFTRWF